MQLDPLLKGSNPVNSLPIYFFIYYNVILSFPAILICGKYNEMYLCNDNHVKNGEQLTPIMADIRNTGLR
jgi:hypothetical protein